MEQLTPQETAVLVDFLTQDYENFSSYCLFRADNADGGERLHNHILTKLKNLCNPQPDEAGEHQIALAEAQLLGFVHGRGGYSLASLFESMGLQRREWEAIKAGYPIRCYLDDNDIGEIEQTVKAA